MTLLQKLKDQGWYLTQEGLKKLTTDVQTEDVQKIIKAALDWDLKEIGGGAIPTKPESNGNIPGRIVLQMQKMRNISAPKANEESTAAPRFLQLELTDGTNSILALELERIPNLNLKIPPGTKLYFKAEKLQLMQGLLVLKEAEVQILGGNVEHMVEKWEIARQMQKYARSNRRLSGSGGPPPWIDFGKRLDAHRDALPQDRNFKSLQAANEKDKNSKENDEFTASRTQAIAEAAKAGQKKVFGGGQQNILDHNVKKILEKGYSEEDAKYALKATNNNLERALYNLKRRNKGATESTTKAATTTVGNQRGRGSAKDEIAPASKPQTNVSLFDFLTDKLPATVTTEAPPPQAASNSSQNNRNPKELNKGKSNDSNAKPQSNTSGNKFENNMSSSFAANRIKPEEKFTPSQNQQSQRSNYNQRDERRSNPPNKQGNRGNERGGRSNVQNNERTSNSQSAPSNEMKAPPPSNNVNSSTSTSNGNGNTNNNNNASQNTNYRTNSSRRNDRNERPPAPRKDQRDQTARPTGNSGGNYQGNRRSQEYRTNDSRPYQQRDNNNRNTSESKSASNYQSNQQNQPPKTSNADVDKLVESTAKLTIQNKKETSYNSSQNRGGRHQYASTRSTNVSSNSSQSKSGGGNQGQQGGAQFIGSLNFTNKITQNSSPQVAANQQHQPQPQPSYVSQLPNGFAYDPSKIMGFQSKEANEYAMNLLKSQGLLPQQSPVAGPQAAAQATQVPPPTQPQLLANPQAAPAVTYMTPSPNSGFVAAPPPPQQGPIPQYGMLPQGGGWNWNVGDLCLAKYWEDGNYYDAKITAVSENTCVVFFLGYGNHEEVVKTDCLPLGDESHYPINAFQGGPPPTAVHAPMQQIPATFLAANSAAGNGGIGGGGGNQRYRGERQMYVPPPKRGANNN
ncbi:tudor domain-containing protein 3 [Musca domestica]|uniref:Survival of motor neuron-related-splicing factor 30 n=1 Tax=Musca domestica TaxID=7370 RepID=A0A1I8MMH0_MUSDO|nr:tudor domain-containing protein 3 [Musca domestica]